jgi:hypothetical protein
MPAGKTYTPLARTTLDSAASTVTFSSISGSYTDLVLVINSKTSSNVDVYYRLNSDTGSNYSDTRLYGNGSAAGSDRNTSQTSARFGTTNTEFGTIVLNLQNYSNSNTYKTGVSRAGEVNWGTVTHVSLWRSTAAVTSIQVLTGSGTFSIGSTFTLYGIAAA